MTNERSRHGCLTAWLIFMIVVNSFVVLANLAFGLLSNQINSAVAAQGVSVPTWAWLVLAGLGIFNIICASALLNWKKWGFYGFLGTSVAAFIVNLSIGVGLPSSLSGFLGIAILYGLLNIGGENRAWPRLH